MIAFSDGKKISADNSQFTSRAFLYGDAVTVYFFVENGRLILAEECYFYLMSSMRKMRMDIPMEFTLDFFTVMFGLAIIEHNFKNGIIRFIAYREQNDDLSAKTPVHYYFSLATEGSVLEIQKEIKADMLKEISVNNNLLSNIHVHCPENTYAEIYARENDLDDVILLNPSKRVARSIFGNLLFLEGETIKIPKQTEGAYISPLMESFVTYIHKNRLATIEETEIIAFESQKADEILVISDEKGLLSVSKIRNREFPSNRFREMVEGWRTSLLN